MENKDPFAALGFTPQVTPSQKSPSSTVAQPASSQSDPFASLGFTPSSAAASAAPQPIKRARYEVVTTPEERLASARADQAKYDEEARKANSFSGFTKNFGKAFVGTIAGSEVGLGKTIGGIINTYNGNLDRMTQARTQNEDTLVKTAKTIREKEAKGIDASADRKFYNSMVDQQEKLDEAVKQITNETDKSGLQVGGELAGTALDVLSFGTYGKGVKVMDSGKLFRSGAIKKTIGRHLTTAEQVLKEIPDAPIKDVAARTITNIADGLTREGFKGAANVIRKLNPASYATLADLTKDISKISGLGLPSILPRGASGLLSKQTLKDSAAGGAVGYGYDVSQGLQGNRGEDRTGAGAFIPGMGTALGAGFPILGRAAQSSENVTRGLVTAEGRAAREASTIEKAISRREDELFAIENNYAKTRKAMDFSQDASAGSRKRVASTDVLVNAVDRDGLVRTKQPGGAIDQYKAMTLDKAEGVVRNDLEREGAKVKPEVVRAALEKELRNAGLEGKALESALRGVDSELSGLMLRSQDGYIPLATIHDAKISTTNGINYMTEPFVKAERKAVASAYKKIVEDNSSLPIKDVNGALGQYLKDIEYLERLDGTRVKGGRLGKYFASVSGNIVGGVVGNAVGGPFGSAVGTIVGGELGARIRSSMFEKTFGTKTGMKATQAPIVEEAIKRSQSPRLGLPAPRDEFRSSVNSNNVIPLPSKMPRSQEVIDASYSKSRGNLNQPQSPAPIINKAPANIKNTVARAVGKNKKQKGSTTLAAALGMASLAAAGTAVLSPKKVAFNFGEQPAAIEAKGDEIPKTINPKVLGDVLAQLESSGGKDKASADPGEMKWVTGLTEVAIKELARLKRLPKNFDKNDQDSVIKASVEYFKLMQERNPNKTPGEIYVDHYWTQWKDEAQRQKKIKQFNQLAKLN